MNTVITSFKDQLLVEYQAYLFGKSEKTIDAYVRIVRQFMESLLRRPGGAGGFHVEQITETAVSSYMKELEHLSIPHRSRVKSALYSFANWLIDEKELMLKNPVKKVQIPAKAKPAPRELTDDQRYVLKSLVERKGDQRSAAIFALGYWAGCRVSDVSWLEMKDAHVGPKVGWLKVGYKGGKFREIDILNEVRAPLYEYIHGDRLEHKYAHHPYVFLSKRGGKLTEEGIHHWLRSLKESARKAEHELIADVTFQDLRHDFAHRCRESGMILEAIADYLGHIKKNGAPAIETTAIYTRPTRAQIKDMLRSIRG